MTTSHFSHCLDFSPRIAPALDRPWTIGLGLVALGLGLVALGLAQPSVQLLFNSRHVGS